MNASFHEYEWVLSHIWMSDWVMPHVCIRPVTDMRDHVTYRNESCHNMNGGSNSSALAVRPVNESHHIYECVRSHIWIHHVTYRNESCRVYEWVMSQIEGSHSTHARTSHERVTHINESLTSHTYQRVTNESNVSTIRIILQIEDSVSTHARTSHTYQRVTNEPRTSHTYPRVTNESHISTRQVTR